MCAYVSRGRLVDLITLPAADVSILLERALRPSRRARLELIVDPRLAVGIRPGRFGVPQPNHVTLRAARQPQDAVAGQVLTLQQPTNSNAMQ